MVKNLVRASLPRHETRDETRRDEKRLTSKHPLVSRHSVDPHALAERLDEASTSLDQFGIPRGCVSRDPVQAMGEISVKKQSGGYQV